MPSNIILEKVGARPWIARIMITWGICSAATAFATGPWSFFGIRVLLGIAEAGLFPGLILWLSPLVPAARIAAAWSGLVPHRVAVGDRMHWRAAVDRSLQLDGIWGLPWLAMDLYPGEGVPTILIGLTVMWCLTRASVAGELADQR